MAKTKTKVVDIKRGDAEALHAILQRAEDDWLTYRDCGAGPKDFGSRQAWRAHKSRTERQFRVTFGLLQRMRNLK